MQKKIKYKIMENFVDLFNCLPMAGSIDDKILIVHGGLSPELKTIDQLIKNNAIN